MNVSVTNAGKAVPGLTAQDFVVTDNKKPVANLKVEPAVPTSIILVLDTQDGRPQDVANMIRDLKVFFGRNGGKMSHRVGLMIRGTWDLQMAPTITTDGNKLLEFLNTAKTAQAPSVADAGLNGEIQKLNNGMNVFVKVMDQIGALPGRKMLIWMGRSWPLVDVVDVHDMSDKLNETAFTQIVQRSSMLLQTNTILYSADSSAVYDLNYQPARWQGFLKPPTSAKSAELSDMALEVFATHSGGQVFNAINNLGEELDHCIADADTFYTVTFDRTPASKADEYHPLAVTLDKPGLTVRTTTGYYAQP